MQRIKVLVVDDSAVFRELLARELEREPEFEVVGRAADPLIAKKLIAQARPDVLTLDVEMPRQDGLSFLSELMLGAPIPVVMVSALTEAGCAATLRAFELGAVDAIAKPRDGDTADLGRRVRDAVRAAAQSRPRARRATGGDAKPPGARASGTHPIVPPTSSAPGARPLAATPHASGAHGGVTPAAQASGPPAAGAPGERPGGDLPSLGAERVSRHLVAIGASTGGTEALKEILAGLPRTFPPIVIVQHMPDAFTGGFARSLAAISRLEVIEAPKGDTELRPGLAVLARGGFHLIVAQEGGRLVAQVRDGPPVRNHKPSVDVLFTSIAKVAADRTLGVILTGMGDDGARGLLKLREGGARTFAQDQASCVVYGMPRRAVELGGVERTVELSELARELVQTLARTPG